MCECELKSTRSEEDEEEEDKNEERLQYIPKKGEKECSRVRPEVFRLWDPGGGGGVLFQEHSREYIVSPAARICSKARQGKARPGHHHHSQAEISPRLHIFICTLTLLWPNDSE